MPERRPLQRRAQQGTSKSLTVTARLRTTPKPVESLTRSEDSARNGTSISDGSRKKYGRRPKYLGNARVAPNQPSPVRPTSNTGWRRPGSGTDDSLTALMTNLDLPAVTGGHRRGHDGSLAEDVPRRDARARLGLGCRRLVLRGPSPRANRQLDETRLRQQGRNWSQGGRV